MIILALDVETTGLNPADDTITELGMVLWSTTYKSPIKIYNELVKNPKQPPLTPFIENLTGIRQPMIDHFGVTPEEAFTKYIELAGKADFILAHNAPFDKGMIEAGILGLGEKPPAFVWVDSQRDIVYPEDCKHKNLTFLGAYHGFVNPFPHRAVTDVLAMLKIADNYDWEEMKANAVSEKVMIRAICEKPWDDDKAIAAGTKKVKDTDVAKTNGFRFNKNTKGWERELPEAHFESFNEKLKEQGIRSVRLKGQGNG